MSTPSDAPPKLELSIVQLLAGTLAAVTAALVASRLGVAGTYIGTAIGSIVATVGGALYTLSIRRTHERLRRLRPHDPSSAEPGPAAESPAGPAGGESVWRRLHLPGNWPVLAGSAAAVFVLSMGTVWAVENFVLQGRAICAITGGCSSSQASPLVPTNPTALPSPSERASPNPNPSPSGSDIPTQAPIFSSGPTARPTPSATAPQATTSPVP